jgi:hypothetical protein
MSEVFTQIDNLTLARSGRVFAAIGRATPRTASQPAKTSHAPEAP